MSKLFSYDKLYHEKMMSFDCCEENLRRISDNILLQQCYEKLMLIKFTFADKKDPEGKVDSKIFDEVLVRRNRM